MRSTSSAKPCSSAKQARSFHESWTHRTTPWQPPSAGWLHAPLHPTNQPGLRTAVFSCSQHSPVADAHFYNPKFWCTAACLFCAHTLPLCSSVNRLMTELHCLVTPPPPHTHTHDIRDQLVQMADFQMSSRDPTDARDMSMILAMSFTAGRGADVRERRLCELTPPLLRSCIGELLLSSLHWCELCYCLHLPATCTVYEVKC